MRGAEGSEGNLISEGHYEFNLLTRNRIQLEAAYRGSWIVGQVIDSIADDLTRAGIEIATNEGAEDLPKIERQFSRLQIWQSISDLFRWGDLYGGCIAVLQIKGQKLDQPLDLDSVQKGQFQGLAIYDRWQLSPVLQEVIDSGPEMGLPKFYDIVTGSNPSDPGSAPADQQANPSQTGRIRVHHSRCIRHVGHKLPFFQAITEMMWGESKLERMWDRLIAFDDAVASTGNLINRAYIRSVGIDGLREILGSGGAAEENLVKHFEYIRQFQTNEGLTLLDKEDVLTATPYAFSGLADIIIQFGQQVSGSAQIPMVRLFGQSPAGMNATGESDIRLYYDSINSKQESQLRNPMEMILKVLWRSVTGNPIPEDLTFSFTPLWQMSAIDKANVAKTNTDTVIEAFQASAIDKPTMMKELKQNSDESGLFTNITDDMIADAEKEAEEEPPGTEGLMTAAPGAQPDPEVPAGGELPKVPEAPTMPSASKDSAMTRLWRFLNG